VAVHVLGRLRHPPPDKGAAQLTDKEIEILTDLSRGFSYKEVAKLRNISPHTVGDHVKSIYRKLQVSSKSEAVFEAVQSGIIKLG
jgi:DNA-binding CsgD family transcriptional regulator